MTTAVDLMKILGSGPGSKYDLATIGAWRPGFVPFSIRMFMWRHGWRRVANHTAKLYWNANEAMWYIRHAIKKGVVFEPLHYAINRDHWKKTEINKLKYLATTLERAKFIESTNKAVGKEYQVIALFKWVFYIFTGIWIGKDVKDKTYCYKDSADADNDTFTPPIHTHRTEVTSYYKFLDNVYYITEHVDLCNKND